MLSAPVNLNTRKSRQIRSNEALPSPIASFSIDSLWNRGQKKKKERKENIHPRARLRFEILIQNKL